MTRTRFIEHDRTSADAAAEDRENGRLLTLMRTSMEKSGKHLVGGHHIAGIGYLSSAATPL